MRNHDRGEDCRYDDDGGDGGDGSDSPGFEAVIERSGRRRRAIKVRLRPDERAWDG